MEIKDIKAIIDLMKKHDLAVFKLEKDGFKLELEAHRPAPAVTAVPPIVAVPAAVPQTILEASAQPGAAVSPNTKKTAQREIKSPMVGTFYRAPSPDSAPYIQVDEEVNVDTVVCIIEAMKVMNEIKAEVQGVIAEVLVENGAPVQFGQPLFRLK